MVAAARAHPIAVLQHLIGIAAEGLAFMALETFHITSVIVGVTGVAGPVTWAHLLGFIIVSGKISISLPLTCPLALPFAVRSFVP